MNVSNDTKLSKKLFKCQICGKITEKRSNAQKYCKKCAYDVNLNDAKILKEKKRKVIHSLGTTNFSGHKTDNFGLEYKRINFEIKKLGFKRQFT